MSEIVEPVIAREVAVRQRDAVREGLAEVVRDTLNSLTQRELSMPPPGVAQRALSDTAITTGMTALRQVQDLGFVEFTTGLITGTFDAIISATIKQMDAYAKLVADLAKSLAQFQAENITDATITGHLANRYPDGEGGTVIRATYVFTDTDADPATGAPQKLAVDKMQAVVSALIDETKVLATRNLQPLTAAVLTIGTERSFTAAQVTAVRTAIGQTLAVSMIDHLRALAREGMARIVVTEGEILSKLTFNVAATDEQRRREEEFTRTSMGVNVRANARWGWGSAAVNGHWNRMNVRTVDQTSFDSVTMNAEIIGQVRLRFKTESFPPITTTPQS